MQTYFIVICGGGVRSEIGIKLGATERTQILAYIDQLYEERMEEGNEEKRMTKIEKRRKEDQENNTEKKKKGK